MSYSVTSPCYNCEKKSTCTDHQLISEAVVKIHERSYDQGHQGCGTIVIACNRQRAVS